MSEAKVCTQCGGRKSLVEFSPRPRMYDGHASQCRACDRKRARRWRQEAPERHREIARRWREANREAVLERGRRRYEANREKELGRARRWRKENAQRHRESVRRSGLRRQRDCSDPEALKDYLQIIGGDPCAYCGAEMEHVDHIDALSVGGGGEWDNLTSACAKCNLSKQTGSLLGFLRQRKVVA